MMMRILAAVLVALTLSTATIARHEGDDHDHKLVIDQPWARTTGNRTVSAAVYLELRNKSAFLEQLTGAKSDIARTVQIHQSSDEGGIMQMRHIDALPIAPGEQLAFEPGGYHVMLIGLNRPLKENDVFPLTLSFEKAGDVVVYVLVTGIAGLQE